MRDQAKVVKSAGDDRDKIEGEQCIELLKKRKTSITKVRKYHHMLETDYAGNKLVVCAF